MQHALESSTPTQGSVLYGTVNGAIGEFSKNCNERNLVHKKLLS